MSKNTKLKNLTFENILKESRLFVAPKEDSYIKTYPEFMSYFEDKSTLSLHDLVVSSHFVYGWMPTIIDMRFDQANSAVDCLNEAKRGVKLSLKQLETLKHTINNSIVGASKLLHFVNPENYAIWDSRINRYTTGRRGQYGVNECQMYLDYLEALEEVESNSEFSQIKKEVQKHFDYHLGSKRVIELLMFEADKRRN